jgi:Polyketide cyclase / dehydrase and lipid transport
MNIRPLHSVLTLAALGIALQTGTAAAADYTTITLNISVDRSADEVWKKVGGFCDIKDWLKLTCVYTSGSGDLGTVRRLADRIDEVMVGKTLHSYTYTQPTTTILYHGTLDVVAEGAHKSRINYSLVYDQSPLTTDEAKAKDRDQRTKAFTGALEAMKKLAEGK